MKLYNSEHKWKYFTKRQSFQIELEIKCKKAQAEKLLEEKKKKLEEAKKQSRLQSRSKSTEPPATRLRARATKKHE